MTVVTTCPNCEALFEVTERVIGEQVRCPHCKQAFDLSKVNNGPADNEIGDAVDDTKAIVRKPEDTVPLRPVLSEAATIPSPQSGRDTEIIPPSATAATRSGEHAVEVDATISLSSGTQGGGPSSTDTSFKDTNTSTKTFGEYELLHEIARGGMGVVFKARQTKANRVVALKMILSGNLAGQNEVNRFYTEAEAAANLDHPNIVPVYDVGQIDGQHYFSMGFVDGQSLKDRVDDGPLPAQDAAQMAKTISEAVAYAHEKGIIHRDLKPSNVLLDQAGSPKISDFGLAKQMDSNSELTATGQVMGTPQYMPPEQAAGKIDEVGPAADVYSLGAILYELLTGRPPFQAASAVETLRLVLQKEPLAPSQLNPAIDRDLETICLKCLEKEISRRYGSARDLADELGRYLASEPILAHPISRPARAWRWCKRNPVVASLATAAVVFLLVGTVVSISLAIVASERANFAIEKGAEAERERKRADDERNSNALAQKVARANGLVEALFTADIARAPDLISELGPYREWTDPLMKQEKTKSANNPRKQLQASLALLAVDAEQVEYLYGRMLTAEPQEMIVIRAALLSHKADLTKQLWTVLENPQHDEDQRFHAACALSLFSPDDPRWENVSDDVAAMLAMQNPFVIAQWTDAFKGTGRWLAPPLAEFLVDEKRTISARGLIATVYDKFAGDIPDAYEGLEDQLTEVVQPSETHGPMDRILETAEANVALAKKQASVGLTLMIVGQGEKVWSLLKHSPDPTVRSYLIERLAQAGVDPKVLLAQLEEQQEASVKRAILLSLGEYGLDRLSLAARQNQIPRLLQLYRDDPDPGIHGAAEWLLRQWRASDEMKAVDKELETGKVEGQRKWYLNLQGQTMVVVPSGEFWRYNSRTGVRYRSRVDRNFAIGSKEVTLEQFLQFRPSFNERKDFTPTSDCPLGVAWYDAVAYCNWLSDQEGIPKEQWCYVPNKDGKYETGMTIPGNSLQRTGYRLLTEQEWAYAYRAGADTLYSFGDSVELLRQYAWFNQNSFSKTQPVGSLKANDHGLFDMLGNVNEWCNETYPEVTDLNARNDVSSKKDQEDNLLVDDQKRVSRGGSIYTDSATMRLRGDIATHDPALTTPWYGFRVVRTYP